jgi:hypothetical protein
MKRIPPSTCTCPSLNSLRPKRQAHGKHLGNKKFLNILIMHREHHSEVDLLGATTCNFKLHLRTFGCEEKLQQILVRVRHYPCLSYTRISQQNACCRQHKEASSHGSSNQHDLTHEGPSLSGYKNSQAHHITFSYM